MEELKIKRGDVVYVEDINPRKDGVQAGSRPYIVVSNDKFNTFSQSLTCIPLTTKFKKWTPTHVFISKACGLRRHSLALCEQIQTIPKSLVQNYMITLPDEVMEQVDSKLKIQLGL